MNHLSAHPLRDRRHAHRAGQAHLAPPREVARAASASFHPLPDGRTLLDLAPMLPDRRARAPLSSHSYLYELKLTGRRVRALVDRGQVELVDVMGEDCRAAFAHIAHSLRLLTGGPHVLDGVCTAQAGVSAAPAGAGATLCLVDLLFHEGNDITGQALLQRKQQLFDLVGPELPSVIYMGHFEDCGRGLWQAVTQLQLNGVMARRKDSAYRAGLRSDEWRVIARGAQAPR